MRHPSRLDELLATAREIWGGRAMRADAICTAMAVVHGDICRAIRDDNTEELAKEMGNMLLSTVRWCDDLGLDIEECLRAAERSQRAFVARRRA